MTSAAEQGLKGRPVVLGEVLYDVFPDGQAVLGGAPFNVAWHLQGFGLAPLLVSAVGRDEPGTGALAAMRAWSMDVSGVAVDPDHPTGEVAVSLDGIEPCFDIRTGRAWDHLDPEAVARLVEGAEISLVYHGSLLARAPASRAALERLAASGRWPVFVDVNLRAPWWEQEAVAAMMARARWLKLNGDELRTLIEGTGASREALVEAASGLRARLGSELVVLTLGAAGAVLATAAGAVSAPAPPPAEMVDAVGAGDAFSAVVILGLHRGWPVEVVLARALDFASAVVAQRGATGADPELYRFHLAAWTEPDAKGKES